MSENVATAAPAGDSLQLNIRFAAEVKNDIEFICQRKGVSSYVDGISHAISLAKTVLELTGEGSRLIVEDKDGGRKQVMLRW